MQSFILFSILVTALASNDVFYLGKNFPNHASFHLHSSSIDVQITKNRAWQTGEINGEVYEGDTIVVTCSSFPNDNLQTLQNQDLFLQNGNVTRKLNHSSSLVDRKTITKYTVVATGLDSGNYTCVFQMGTPKMKKQFVNVVRTQRSNIKKSYSENRTIEFGSAIEKLECEIDEGVPPPNYVWRKNWDTIESSSSRFLTIENVKSTDEGKYMCSAYNRAGSAHLTLNVNVIGVHSISKSLIEKVFKNQLLIGVILLLIMLFGFVGFCIYRRLTARYLKIKNDEEIAASMKFSPNLRIKFGNLTIMERLGDGNFGVVEAGILEINKKLPPLNVAVKSSRTARDILQTSMINEEYEIMKGIRLHPNVLTLIGGVYDMENNTTISKIVFELGELGSLSDYLSLQKYNSQKNEYNDKVEKCKEKLSFAYQIASGMEYISKIPCVHRDLAARNVLLKSNKICRIADFGLTRLHENKDYYRARYDCEIPIRWMSIESITESRYTQKSDVWSFGIVLFEIFSLGEKPYPNIESENIQKYIIDGNINDKPQDCHPIIYELMKKCWRKNPKKRPEFTECVKFFEKCFKSNFPEMFAELQSTIQYEADKQQKMESMFDY